MNLISLAHYAAFLMYVWLIAFILIKNPKALLNRVCALGIGCFIIWSFAGTLFYSVDSKSQAMLWMNIASFGWCSFASFALWFALILVKQKALLSQWYFYVLMLLIPAFFIYMQWSGYLIVDVHKNLVGWTSVWSSSIWSWLYYTYYLSFVGAALFLCYTKSRKAKFDSEKKQARVIFATGSMTLILSTITDVCLTRFQVAVTPPMGAVLSFIWVGGITYAVTKYKLMVLTPAYAASDIIGAMNDSLMLIDPEGNLIEANPAALKLLGYTRAELLGQPAALLFFETPAIFKQFNLMKYFQDGAFPEHRICFRGKNGQSIPVSLSSAIMRDQAENIIGAVVIARDLSELLRLQEKEQEFMVEKAQAEALQERALELEAAYNQLKAIQAQLIQSEKMAAVGQLAGGVAHEVNNPLGIILGFAQGIVRRIPGNDPLYLPLKSIEREAVRCKKLVGDLLTFSRAGKTRAEIIDINIIIDETLSLIEAQARIKNIEIVKKYETGLPRMTAHKNQLQQVIMNLCNNAIDAMPDGGVITIFTGATEDQLEIAIRDTGQGMTEEVKNRLFEPFFTTKEAGKGTGLGLSLCDEIIRKHHGIIEVETDMGKSSTFRIKLPITN